MYDLIIIGGGPAGLTAAIYAIRKRLNVFLISLDLGGKTNYRMELPDTETHQVIRGVEVVEKFWRELDYLEFARRLARHSARAAIESVASAPEVRRRLTPPQARRWSEAGLEMLAEGQASERVQSYFRVESALSDEMLTEFQVGSFAGDNGWAIGEVMDRTDV